MTEHRFTIDQVKRMIEDTVTKTIDMSVHAHRRALQSLASVIHQIVYEDFCKHFKQLTGICLQADEADRQKKTQQD